MTFTNNPAMLIDEEGSGNMSNNSKIQDKKVWKSLRTHILFRREKNKQGTLFIFIYFNVQVVYSNKTIIDKLCSSYILKYLSVIDSSVFYLFSCINYIHFHFVCLISIVTMLLHSIE